MRVVSSYLFDSAHDRPDAVALVCGEQRLTFGELASRASSLAGYLVSHGLQKGDRVAIFLENSADAVVAIFATLHAGGCFVVINCVAPAERLSYIVRNCEAKFLISSATRLSYLDKALECCMPHKPTLVLAGGQEQVEAIKPQVASLQAIYEAKFPDPVVPVTVADVAAIIYTSGSTGEPKGAIFLHGNIDAATDSISEYLEHTEKDVILSVLPLASSYGLLQVLVPFRTRGCVVLEKGMSFPYEFIRRIKEEHVTGFAGNPTLFAILLRLQGVEHENLSSLRYATNAAAALPVPFIPRIQRIFPTAKLFLMHGLTECLRTSYLHPGEIATRPTSIGTGMRNVELWIEDSGGSRLGHGETGELVVHGPTVMQGYWNDPEGTARVLRLGRSPWLNTLRSGDLFRLDGDGYFHFVARSDEVIKSRGEKVSPVEIEDVLYKMDGILETRVLGVPDALLGYAVKAEIVLTKGQVLSVHQVKAHCQRHLEEFKVPQIVEFVDAIPRTQAGKITRGISGD